MKILIGGDSWGCGEWGYINGNYGILHSGLEHYLKDNNHIVINTSKGRSSNNESIARINEALTDDTNLIIWFQSDPLRDYHEIYFNKFTEILDINFKILDNNYKDLQNLGKKIYILGGCSKISDKLILKYNNLTPLINSIPEFLYPQFVHPDIWVSDFVWDNLYNSLNNEILENILKRKEIVDSLHFEPYTKYFQPDGRHPNRFGHQKIYEYLKTYFI
jgi:hypothetical protein